MLLSEKIKGNKESKTHFQAKNRVAEICQRDNKLIINIQEGGRWSAYQMDTLGCEIITECAYPHGVSVDDKSYFSARYGRLPEMIFDVGFIKDGKVVAGVELSLSHWIDAKKAAKIRATNVIILEVHAFHEQWNIPDLSRIECENLFLPVRPLVDFRRLRVGDIL